jgi:hypothetical protein
MFTQSALLRVIATVLVPFLLIFAVAPGLVLAQTAPVLQQTSNEGEDLANACATARMNGAIRPRCGSCSCLGLIGLWSPISWRRPRLRCR